MQASVAVLSGEIPLDGIGRALLLAAEPLRYLPYHPGGIIER